MSEPISLVGEACIRLSVGSVPGWRPGSAQPAARSDDTTAPPVAIAERTMPPRRDECARRRGDLRPLRRAIALIQNGPGPVPSRSQPVVADGDAAKLSGALVEVDREPVREVGDDDLSEPEERLVCRFHPGGKRHGSFGENRQVTPGMSDAQAVPPLFFSEASPLDDRSTGFRDLLQTGAAFASSTNVSEPRPRSRRSPGHRSREARRASSMCARCRQPWRPVALRSWPHRSRPRPLAT